MIKQRPRFYREVFQEGRQEGQQQLIARLRQRSFSVNEVAELLALSQKEITELWENNQ